MKYTMKSGALTANDIMLARIKPTFIGAEKKIYTEDGSLAMRTNIEELKQSKNPQHENSCHQYVMFDEKNRLRAVAKPGYAEGSDPSKAGQPICRIPRTDHAQVMLEGKEYLLVMHNGENYTLSDKDAQDVLQIYYKGIGGGWNIEVKDDLKPEIICGIFVFCKYIEQENAYWVV